MKNIKNWDKFNESNNTDSLSFINDFYNTNKEKLSEYVANAVDSFNNPTNYTEGELKEIKDSIYNTINNSFHHETAANTDPTIVFTINVWRQIGNNSPDYGRVEKSTKNAIGSIDSWKNYMSKSYAEDPNWDSPT